MKGLHDEAARAAAYFRVCVCGSESDYMRGRVTVLKHDAPAWLREALDMAHVALGLNGYSDPDNFKYDAARRAVEAIAANPGVGTAELEASFAARADVESTDLLDWLHSDSARMRYCDRVLRETSTGLSTRELLRGAQALELREVFQVLRAAVQARYRSAV
jgi:hypothetical protein